jgi:hypothetical protein
MQHFSTCKPAAIIASDRPLKASGFSVPLIALQFRGVFPKDEALDQCIFAHEAAELSKVIDNYARTLQSVEFEERLAKLVKAIPK